MNNRRRSPLTQVTSLLVAATFTLSATGCLSSTETINTDRTYLLGPKTSSEPGPATRDVTMRAVDTRGTLAFHLDRARECTITSTPRFQKVHVEGKIGKRIAAGIISGALLTAAGAGLIVGGTIVSPEGLAVDDENTVEPNDGTLTGGGWMALTGIIVGVVGLFILPRGIYHAAVSGTTVTAGDVKAGTPPLGAVRAPKDYDPKDPQVTALSPRMEQPRYDVFAFGSKPAGEIQGFAGLSPRPAQESLRSGRAFDRAVAPLVAPADGGLLAIPQASGGGVNDEMRACVAKHTPSCQAKCGANKNCILSCLREPCVENLGKEGEDGGGSEADEYTSVISKTEVCERSADSGIALALVVKDLDGVPKTIDIGKTDKGGDVKKDLLAGLEVTYAGWPNVTQVILQEAQVVLVEDPGVVLGKLDLAKYPGLKYAEHVQSTKKVREAMALAEAARREKEAKEKQAMLEAATKAAEAAAQAAAKAADDAAHADERKAEAAAKAAQCASNYRNKCNADCQGNQACVKKCLQKAPACK